MLVRKIRKTIFDRLYADTRLCQAGDAYTDFLGTTRNSINEVKDLAGIVQVGATSPQNKYINLFEKAYTNDSINARPGIYIGMEGFGGEDIQDGPPAISNGLMERRALLVPLMVVCADQNAYTAIAMRDQLVDNLLLIIFDMLVVSPWYELRSPGRTGGGQLAVREWDSSSGQNTQGMCEAYAALPLLVRYQRSKYTSNS